MGRNRSRLETLFGAGGLLSLAVFALFFGYPLAGLIWRALSETGHDFGHRLRSLLTGNRFQKILVFSFAQAAASALFSIIAAWPLTWALANRRFRGREIIRSASMVPFVLPTVVVAGAVTAFMNQIMPLLGFGSFSNRDGFAGLIAILAAHVFFNIAVVVRTVGGFWQQLDNRVEQAARSLGAGPVKVFFSVTVPRLGSAVLGAFGIVFFFSFTSFAIILLLGGARRSNLETEIYRFALMRAELDIAAVLALIQIVTVIAIAAAQSLISTRRHLKDSVIDDRAVFAVSTLDRIRIWICLCGSLLGLLVLPLALVHGSIYSPETPSGYSIKAYRALTTRVDIAAISAFDALVNSIKFAAVATALTALLATITILAIAYGTNWIASALNVVWVLPLGVSALTLGFGILITFDKDPINWRNSWMIVPVTHALIGVVFVIRSVVPILKSIDPDIGNAARLLGASPWRVIRTIDFALARRALISGLGFAFAVSLGEFGASSFLARGNDQLSAPLVIARLLSTPGTALERQALALATVLMLLVAAVSLATSKPAAKNEVPRH